jgi:hypothetical protein
MQVMTATLSDARVKRPVGIAGLLIVQGVWSVALLALVIYLFILSLTHRENASGLQVAGLIFALPALLIAIGWYGLWKGKLWGWWVACIADCGMAAVFVYAVIDDGWSMIDWALVAIAAFSLVLPVWLIMPATRRFYRSERSLYVT